MPRPSRAAAREAQSRITNAAVEESKAEKNPTTKPKRKRTRAKRGRDDGDEEEVDRKEKKDADGDDEMGEGTESSASASASPRAKKKTKRSDTRSPSPAASDRAPSPATLAKSAAAAASSSAIAHLAHVRSTNSTLKCDSDCLSLVFSFLTTKEFGKVMHVDKRWFSVSKMKTSWPRYNFVSTTASFRHQHKLHPAEVITEQQHRRFAVHRFPKDEVDLAPLIKHGVAKNVTYLKLAIDPVSRFKWNETLGPELSIDDSRGQLTSSNFPQLSQLEYEATLTRCTEGRQAYGDEYQPGPVILNPFNVAGVVGGPILTTAVTAPITDPLISTVVLQTTVSALSAPGVADTTDAKAQRPPFSITEATAKSNPTFSLAGQLRVLKLVRYDWQPKEVERPLLLTIGAIASFTRLEVLTLHDSCIPDECLVQLHHLRTFRIENNNFRLPLGAVRCVRYLSVMHSLRLFFIEPGKTPLAEIITILCNSQWPDTLPLVAADSKLARQRKYSWFSNSTAPVPAVHYDDPIPSDEHTTVEMNRTGRARLDEFELAGEKMLHFDSFHRVLAIPLKRLTCQLTHPEPPLSFVWPRVELPIPDLFPDELTGVPDAAKATLERIEHLDLLIDRVQISLEGLAECKNLRSFQLNLVRNMVWDNRDFSTWLPSLSVLEELTLEFHHDSPVKIHEDTWTAMGELKSLRRLDVKVTVDRPFPSELLAQSLATLPNFHRLDLRLECEKHIFALPPGFFAAVTSSSTWRYFHFAVKSIYKGMAESKTNDLKKLTTEQLLSDTLQRFRVYRHCRPTSAYTGHADLVPPVTTQYRIGVKETKSATAKYQPYWQDVDDEDGY